MKTGRKPRIAIVHCGSKWIGGAEAVAVWTLEALKGSYEIDLISINEPSVDQINYHYGTSLNTDDFRPITMSLPFGLQKSMKLWYLRRLILMRLFQKMATRYDLCISTYYEMDFGRRGIQYVHSPAVAAGLVNGLEDFLDENQRSAIKRIYRKLAARVFNLSIEGIKRNLTLVNSKWTGQLIKRAYGIDPYVVYPPVSAEFPHVPWEEKEDGFICIGRITPSKRIDMIIRILKLVREAGYDVHLHIVGEPWDPQYFKKIEVIQRRNSSWVFLEGRLEKRRLSYLTVNHKYGIHGMRNEHFGIAVAEMVKAGNIVFVPNDGGQVEIVNDQWLIYEREEEAAKKIIAVLSDEELQFSLREHLSARSSFFSTDRFMERIQEIVNCELARKE